MQTHSPLETTWAPPRRTSLFPSERRSFRRELTLPVGGLFWRKARMRPERSAKPEGESLAE